MMRDEGRRGHAQIPKTQFFPTNEPQFINAFIEAPIGTDIVKTDSVTRIIEQQVMKVI